MSVLEVQMQLVFVPTAVPDRPVRLRSCGMSSDMESGARVDCPAGHRPGLPIGELHDRVLQRVEPSVRRSHVPNPGRLERLLAWHVDRGEVELVDGEWRLTQVGRRRFSGLLDPMFAAIQERAAA